MFEAVKEQPVRVAVHVVIVVQSVDTAVVAGQLVVVAQSVTGSFEHYAGDQYLLTACNSLLTDDVLDEAVLDAVEDAVLAVEPWEVGS